MAKRSRGSSRPGQRRPVQRAPQRPANELSRPAGGLSAAEETRAAELEAQIVAEERAAQNARSRGRDRGAVAEAGGVRSASPLAVRAAEEYTYVVRDVRRIVTVGGGMLVLLAALYILHGVAKVF